MLYNNASLPVVGPWDDLTVDDWHAGIRNELDLVFYACKVAWPHLVARGGGSIINIASIASIRGAAFFQQAAHGAAKGGVLSFTYHLAAAGGKHGIRAINRRPATVIKPPLKGDGWLATTACCTPNLHRDLRDRRRRSPHRDRRDVRCRLVPPQG